MFKIKPHHFIDIIKLYGAGLTHLVPDEKMMHDFYKVGNAILQNKQETLALTVEGDDICIPCLQYQNGLCQDALTLFEGFDQKDTYNKMIDFSLINLVPLNMKKTYTAGELCEILYRNREVIFKVWNREPADLLSKRYALFKAGAERYLGKADDAAQP